MKKRIFFLIITLSVIYCNAQITLQQTYSASKTILLTKLHTYGYKYYYLDAANLKIYMYNPNHSLFKTISIPTSTFQINSLRYVSQKLFNTDTLIEYALVTYTGSGSPHFKLFIYDENGNQIFYRDSASFNNSAPDWGIFAKYDPIHYDGTGVKMRLNIGLPPNGQVEFYSLPGTIPCQDCDITPIIPGNPSGIVSPAHSSSEPLFYPNPASNQVRLKYDLPRDYKNAEIKIQDAQGKLLQSYQVTDAFNDIYIPSDYANGLYFYTLIVDGKAVKTEKIIHSK